MRVYRTVTRACVCCGPMKIVLHGKFKTHIPRQAWARYREKHRESSKGREYEKRGMLTETQRGKRQTVDSRGLRWGRKEEGGGWFRDKEGREGERKEYKKHTKADRKGSGPFPTHTQEGEKKGNTGRKKTASERASIRGRERRTPASKKITIFAYVNYRLTRMNDRPRYFRPPVRFPSN